MKLFRNIALIAIAVVSSFAFTSCVDNNKESSVSQYIIALLKSDGTFEQLGGGILVPSTAVYSEPGMYTFQVSYDPNGFEGNKLPVTITSELVSIENYNVVEAQSEVKGNIPMYALDYQSQVTPYRFNEDYLIIPCMFWVEEVSSTEMAVEVAKHNFSLSYVINEGTDILDLYLTDNVSDISTKRERFTSQFQAFNISRAIDMFLIQNPKLSTIRIHANVNSTDSDITNESYCKSEYYDIAYSAS